MIRLHPLSQHCLGGSPSLGNGVFNESGWPVWQPTRLLLWAAPMAKIYDLNRS
jgi:hypothetical protein